MSNFSFSVSSPSGFWWNGVWHPMKPSHGEDDGPPTGVREPRRPRPGGSPAAAVKSHVESENLHVEAR